jgi:hypothetical protein
MQVLAATPLVSPPGHAAHGRQVERDRVTQFGPCLTSSERDVLRPYRALALRVLARALQDVGDPAGTWANRESAREFFAGSFMLHHWCRIAAIDPVRMAHAALTGIGPTGLPPRHRR